MAEAQELLDRLSTAWSLEHGMRLLNASGAELNENVPAALLGEALQLRREGDEGGAKEHEAWARRARAIRTRREFLAQVPEDKAEFDRRLSAFADRFDDGLFELWFDLAGGKMQRAESREDTGVELAMLRFVADAAHRADRAAEVKFYDGTRQLLMWQDDRANKELRRSADATLQSAAEDMQAAPEVRARAEANRAVLAGAEQPEKVAGYQAQAQQYAENGKDQALLRGIRRDRAWWARKRGDAEATLELLRANIKSCDREIWGCRSPIAARKFVADMLPDIRMAVEVCLERGAVDPVWFERALEFAEHEKARPFLRAAALVARQLGPVPARLQRRRAMLVEELRRVGANLEKVAQLDPSAEGRANEILQALGEVEAEIEAAAIKAFVFDMRCRPLDFKEMMAEVPPGAAILSFYVLPERTVAFLLTGSGLAGDPVVAEIPESRIAQYRVELDLAIQIRGNYATFDELQTKLDMEMPFFWPNQYLGFFHKHLIAPFGERLSGISQLWISPHAGLLGLPVHALTGPDGVPLNDRLAIVYTPGIAVLARCRRADRANRATMFVTGTDAGGPALRGPREEAAAVAQIWGTSPSPAKVNTVLDGAVSADIMHLSCHSNRLNASTLYQGLELEDGTLTAFQIAQTPFAASLVTLSACDVLGGDLLARAGDELSGMLGAFLRSGVPRVVATLWPLSDRMAVPLMTKFYAALRDPRVTVAAALASAAKEVRLGSPPEFQHPYFWAPFCVWGDA